MKYIVEHMESVLGEWAALEYQHICQVVGKNNLYLTSLDPSAMAMVPQQLKDEAICSPHNVLDPELGLCIEKIILLDPQATEELMPEGKKEKSP